MSKTNISFEYPPAHLTIEQKRKWFIDKINQIDSLKREIKEGLDELKPKSKSWYKAKDKISYLSRDRSIFRDELGEINKQIKKRNLEMHSQSSIDQKINSEIVFQLKESYQDLFENLRQKALTNIAIQETRSNN